MSEQPTLWVRMKNWFNGFGRKDDTLPLEAPAEPQSQQPAEPSQAIVPAAAKGVPFWRPWAKRDAAIASLQQGFNTLTDLMTAIREHLVKQGERQDEMLGYMSNLPEVLQSLPESQRVQAEALKGISTQLNRQIAQEERLSDILEKVTDTCGEQRKLFETLTGQTETLSGQNEAISSNLQQVGSAMEGVGRSTEASAQVLQQLHQDLEARNSGLEKMLKGQNTRLTVLLAVAIGAAALALVAACVVGFLLLRRLH